MYRSRILKEATEAAKNKDKQVILFMNNENIFKWKAYIMGPEDTPYKDGIFELKITLTSEYPIKAPSIVFVNRIFHPNIHFESGEICLEVLKESWTPNWTLEAVCRAISSLLMNPNPESPLNCDCGNLLRANDREGYESMAKMYTLEYSILKSNLNKELL